LRILYNELIQWSFPKSLSAFPSELKVKSHLLPHPKKKINRNLKIKLNMNKVVCLYTLSGIFAGTIFSSCICENDCNLFDNIGELALYNTPPFPCYKTLFWDFFIPSYKTFFKISLEWILYKKIQFNLYLKNVFFTLLWYQ